MAKTQTPFLSLGARGTVGGFLTTQKSGKATILREKPVPTDPYSLAQFYQRYLYQDYAYLWTQQSEATRQTYATAGSRHHLTGFQYWMKYHLTNLPDILAFYHYDPTSSAILIDYSRLGTHLTTIGATWNDLPFGKGYLHYDGINDYSFLNDPPGFTYDNGLSIEIWATIYPTGTFAGVVCKQSTDTTIRGISHNDLRSKSHFLF